MNHTTDCPFCLEFTDPGSFARRTLPEWPFHDRVIARNDGAALIPTLGPVVPRTPYVLAIPRSCSPSFLDTPAEERAAMLELIDRLLGIEELYPTGRAVVFEHGGHASGGGCNCVNHCHLHVMNIVGPWAALPAEFCRRHETLGFDADAKAHHPGPRRPYLFAGFYGRETGVIRGSIAYAQKEEKQLFRRIISELAGESEYDYRLLMHTGTMIDTYRIAHDRMNETRTG